MTASLYQIAQGFLIVLIVAPLLFSLICAALPKRTKRWAFEMLHIASISVVLISSLATFGFVCLGLDSNADGIWLGGLWFRVDALEAVFVLLIGIVGFMAGLCSVHSVRCDRASGRLDDRRVRLYYVLYSLFLFAMIMAVTSNNIIIVWASIEVTTLATAFLVGIYHSAEALEAAYKYTIVCTVGVAFGMLGTLLVYANAVTVLANPGEAAFFTSILSVSGELDPTLMRIAFVFAFIGFGTKAGLVPMHTWVPDAHSQAPSPISALLSGVLLKVAVLVIVRFRMFTALAAGEMFVRVVLLVSGLLSVVIGALALVTQPDLKRRLAYSSIENVGLVVVCLGFGGTLGIAAALLQCLFHGLAKALLFCVSGDVVQRYGTTELAHISGIAHIMPATATLMCLGLFALTGFPPAAVFVSEMTAFMAGAQADMLWAVVVVAIALLISIVALLWIIPSSVFGEAPAGMVSKSSGEDDNAAERGARGASVDLSVNGDINRASPLTIVPQICLLALLLWFGVALPAPISQCVDRASLVVVAAQQGISTQTEQADSEAHSAHPVYQLSIDVEQDEGI